VPATDSKGRYILSSVEDAELALEVVPAHLRDGLVYQEYCLMRLAAEGRTMPRWDMPFGDAHWWRFVYATPEFLIGQLLVWALALFRMWYAGWVFPGIGLFGRWFFMLLLVALAVASGVDTFGPKGKAARLIRRASKVDPDTRKGMLEKALRLELHRPNKRFQLAR